MAEFKLGRIKFVYQGAWAPSVAYVVDDVVTVGGKTYICVTSNTSSSIFGTDFNSGYWNIVADGSRWSGTWTNGTYYQLGDQVLYGGVVYQCTTAHTSASSTATFTATGFTVAGGTGTVTFTNASGIQPYLVGSTITLAGFSPSATSTPSNINTTFTVTACTATSVSVALTGTYTVSVLGTVAGTSQLGLEANQSSWTTFAANFNWIAGGWTVNTRYKVRDLITYNGITYVCNTAHVSAATTALGLETNDSAKWDVFNAGLYYSGAWTTTTRYKLNDIVKAGASLWICTTPHTSAGSTIDTIKFSMFVNGVEFLNVWSSSTNYVIGDIITYGGNTYTAILNGSNQNPSTATTYWQLFTAGFSFQNDWSSASSYKVGSVVRLGGYSYLAIADNAVVVLSATATTTGTNLITVSSTDGLVAGLPITFTGSTFGGIQSGVTYYIVNPAAGVNQITVSAQSGGSVFSITSSATGTMTGTTNPTPPFSTYWTRLNSGIRWNATIGTYTGLTTTNVTGSGSSATFSVLASKTNYSVTLSAGGTGYSATAGSNTIKILGTSLGGLSPANDITITITGVSSGAITTFTSTGYSVTWASGTSYVLGDAVYFGANSYICINAHIGASGNRPDADTLGTYWNLLASGSESAVLTTTGDLAYYGASGPTRLPVGQDGQILRVTGSVPGWAYYGLINNIVYVSPAGIDTTVGGQGLTIDKPWATIRYACYQIENGYLNTNATSLLQINKQFILKEVNNYVQNQYSVNVTSTSGFNVNIGGSSTSSQTTTANLYIGMPITFSTSSGNIVAGTTYYVATINSSTQINIATSYANAFVPTLFSVGTGTTNTGTYAYSASKTERDTGFILDGIIFDIGHGGNWKTVTNAQAYFTYPYPSSTLATNVQPYDLVPFTAALNYMNTLTGSVLNNAAPTNNYQALNGISLGNRAIQNTTSGVSGATQSGAVNQLVSIVTTALSTSTTVGMVPMQTPNTTISVKTGTYNEILPIVVPSYTAIVGDELRSTVVQPSPVVANLINDKPKSIATLTRIQSTLANLVTNATVTPTTGNTVSQVTSLPAGDTGSSASANTLLSNVSIMQNMISNGLQQAPAFSYTNPTNYNTSYLVGFGYGTAQIAQNYNFIKAEIIAYLVSNYGSTWTQYGSTNQTNFIQQIGFILDGLQYDMTYGCNNQSIINGSSFYSLQIPQIASTYTAMISSALSRLQTIISTISTASSVSPTSGNTVVQLLSGTAGSTAAGAFAQSRVADILYWFTNGAANSNTAVFVGSSSSSTTLNVSSVTSGTIAIGMCITGTGIAAGTYIISGSGTTWTMSVSQTISSGTVITGSAIITPITSGAYALASSTLQGVYTNLQARRSEIASDTQAYIAKYYQQYPISSSLTNRDAGLIVDALSWDLLLGTNSNSIVVGRAFNRLNSSATALRNNANNELTATLASLTFIGFKAKLAAANGAVTQASLLIDDIITTINGQAQVTTFATAITSNNITLASGSNITVGNTVVFGGNLGNLVQGTTYYVLTASSNVITVSTAYSGSVFVAGTVNTVTGQVSATFSPTLTTATTSTNLLTLTSTYGMSVNMPISFVSLPAVITANATATSSSGNTITLASSAFSLGIAVGQQIYFTGVVFGNLVPNQMYYVLTAVGSTITVSLTNSGSSINLVTASGSMTVNANNSGNLWNNNVYWINSISGNQITVTSSFKSGTAYAINNTVSSMSAVATAGYVSKVLYLNNPMINGSTSYNNTLATINGTEVIRANIPFLAADAVAYTLANYGGGANAVTGTTTSTNIITTSANHNFVIGDPVQFSATTVTTTATSVSSNVITVSSTANMVIGMPITFSGTVFGTISNVTTYYILTIPGGAGNGTTITVSTAPGGSTAATGTGTGTMSVTAGGIFGGLVTGTQYYVLTTPSTTTFTISATQAGTGTQTSVALTTASGIATVNYYFNTAKCTRDTTNYLNAIIYDINYLGNYKTQRAAELYVNAVNGSTSSNMYLVRNACGVRNQTLNGITGYLGGVNSFGTKRPTGGAYTSLDPGFGPNDTNVQVLTRSTYVQNCTMFGYAAVGAKVDGALHTAGNKSIVANDYTCVIGDGIGWWNTGSGSLAELVSVFNYYSYAGYLAELGGRIRATNGNSSYGTYGVVSETVDTFETPIYGTVNNRAFGAQVTNVVTDSTTQILCLEYEHAGLAYTNSVPLISGTGYNILATQDEFRDAAVTENRIVDLNNSQGVGGSYYVTVTNVAQGGATGYITIAATDSALTGAYNGMRIQLTAGTAVGQYANILAYSNGSKVALLIRPTFVTLTITATTTGSPGVATVASTATLYANMPFYVGTAVGGLSVQTVYYVRAVVNSTTFSVTTSPSGTADPITATTTSQSSTLYAAGWDHIVAGTPLTNPDLTSAYIIEPAISFVSPGYTATARTMSATASWTGVAYGSGNYVAVSNGTSTAFSTTGKTWTAGGALPASTTWNQLTYAGGQGASVSVTVGGFGGSGAILTANLGTGSTLSQVVSVTVVNGGYNYTTPPTITFTATNGGSGATAVATVLNGSIQTVTITINGSGYNTAPTVNVVTSTVTAVTPVTYGKNYLSTPTVALSAPFSGTVWSSSGAVTSGNYYYYYNGTTQATNYYQANASGNFNSSAPTFTSGTQATGYGVSLTYVGTLATVTPTLTNAGISGYTLTNGGFGYTTVPTLTITDGASRFVAISNSGNSAYAVPTALGANWTAGGALPSANFTGLAWGNGVYVAVGGTGTTPSCASSADGAASWVSRSIPGSVTYSSVAWGPTGYSTTATNIGLFVAISTGSNVTAYSINGTTWTQGGNLPSSATWTSITWGNGRFVAVASSSTKVAYSYDGGATWRDSTVGGGAGLPVSQAWSQVSYGAGLFVAIATSSAISATSPDGINWVGRAMPSSSNWASIAYGNPSATNGVNPLWVAVSSTSGTIGASIHTGATTTGRVKVSSNVVSEIRMWEPGSGYPKGLVSATSTTSGGTITVDNTENLVANQPVEFNMYSGNLITNTTYYVIAGSITSTTFQVSAISGSVTPFTLVASSPTGMTYTAGPLPTVTDPNRVNPVAIRVRTGDGALGNPSFANRGSGNSTATATQTGDGYSDLYQNSAYINIAGLYSMPSPGANVQFATITGSSQWYKLVIVTNILGIAGNYTAQFQVSPALSTLLAPPHGTLVTTRLKYSQVRLTGHDFLYTGTGNQTQTNYPYVDPSKASQANQQYSTGGGRNFFTSTDQDGNFNVGNLFGVQQATGTASLNANAFNLAGLQSLTLSGLALGAGSATITQFSTDPYFTANSDNIVPTQKAIKSYISAQIGGGQSQLNVNTLTAGQIFIANNSISNTTGNQIYVSSKMNFAGGIDGAPVALVFFGQH
jgi:hypothetical protein